jgi:metal-sulfur cluster biosynthetic enzyme
VGISITDPFYKEKQIAMNALYRVVDPELLVNIVDLGLIYGLDIAEEKSIQVTMTLSTRYCPMGEAITIGIRNVLSVEFPAKEINVRVVWEPKWDYSMISDEGRSQLGI